MLLTSNIKRASRIITGSADRPPRLLPTNHCMNIDVTAFFGSNDFGVNPNVIIRICVALVCLAIYRSYRRPRTTKLRGPPSNDVIFGVAKDLFIAPNLGGIYRNWENTYGPVYQIPAMLGSTVVVLGDPKAVTYLYSNDTSTYHQAGIVKAFFKNIMMVSFCNGSCI